jgi:hypothetical protein
MDSTRETISFWLTALGTILSILGLVQAHTWLIGFGALLFVASLGLLFYALREREQILSATVRIGERSIDSLNIASLLRRLNRSLVIQEANHRAEIEGEHLTITWQYAGYCRAAREGAIEFSVDTDNNIPFDSLGCRAYDLRHDPERRHPLRPVLVGPDGISKKIAVPFLEPLAVEEPFNVLLSCELPGCMKDGFEYYTSTLSFAQQRVPHVTTRIIFRNSRPQWLRAYDCDGKGNIHLLKDMRPARETSGLTEYLDVAHDVPARSARIYVFQRRSMLERLPEESKAKAA